MSQLRQLLKATGKWGGPGLAVALVAASALALDPQDSETNPVSGDIESVIAVLDGADYEIQHVDDPGSGAPLEVHRLSASTVDDLDPKIAIRSGGATSVVWWRDSSTPQVWVSERASPSVAFGSAAQLSDATDGGKKPRILVHDGSVWVAYRFDGAAATSLAVLERGGGGDPWPSATTVGTSAYTGDVDQRLHSESGHLWMTWVDSSTDIGWAEWDDTNEEWSVAQVETDSGGDFDAARARIRSDVLN